MAQSGNTLVQISSVLGEIYLVTSHQWLWFCIIWWKEGWEGSECDGLSIKFCSKVKSKVNVVAFIYWCTRLMEVDRWRWRFWLQLLTDCFRQTPVVFSALTQDMQDRDDNKNVESQDTIEPRLHHVSSDSSAQSVHSKTEQVTTC